ncbi:GNAT family N-acetyltransferase [Streptomyces sp. NPDC000594]|uniref:GNAT family N-acetyltransferase n=1 Tax=Streptomyces sp. NPDC000594 TaxID=3154261 RepID=UPI0033255389
MTNDLRVLDPGDWDTWYEDLSRAYGGMEPPPERRALRAAVTEYDRSLGVWEDGGCVGAAAAYSFRMTVPGGRSGGAPAPVATAAVSMVGVVPTHRRRGILTAMMRHQLDNVRARGEALAVLTASEPAIYGRYGYGIASRQLALEVDSDRARITEPPDARVRLRSVDPVHAAEGCAAIRDRLAADRPGGMLRPGAWDAWPLLDPPSDRGGGSPLQCVLAERDGEPSGFALYQVRPAWSHAGPVGTVTLRELHGLDPSSATELWRFLLGIDLTSSVHALNRPLDEPLLHRVADPRRCEPRLRDGLHLRLVEVGAALAARAYRVPVDTVLEVTDPFCLWNTGRWRLSGDPSGAVCARTADPADLSLSVRELGSAYLGGITLRELADAGLVRECAPGALETASLAFGSTVPPWLAQQF